MNSKIFFTDLDGTLLNDRKEITPGNRAAISEALSAGHKIVIATGRPLASARIQAERLGLTGEGCYAITYNGGLIYDSFHQNVLLGTPVPKELLAPIFTRCCMSMGIHVHTLLLHTHLCQNMKRLSCVNMLLRHCFHGRSFLPLKKEFSVILFLTKFWLSPAQRSCSLFRRSFRHIIPVFWKAFSPAMFCLRLFLPVFPRDLQ